MFSETKTAIWTIPIWFVYKKNILGMYAHFKRELFTYSMINMHMYESSRYFDYLKKLSL